MSSKENSLVHYFIVTILFQIETAINVAQSCAHITENDKKMFLIGIKDEESLQAHIYECTKIITQPGFRDFTLVVDGTSMSQILDTPTAPVFANIALKCTAVLCCRLSPIQKAQVFITRFCIM